jgi:NADH:ubiquinone oxidoreductase subunit H
VVLDVRPASPSPLARRRAEDEGRKTLSFLGIRIGERAPAAGGILIAAVEPGSRADGAGLKAGEIVSEVDGVRVGSLADVVPVGGHAATLVVRSALGTDARTVRVSIEGLKTRISPDVLRAGVLVGGALALLWLLLRPSAGTVAWLERRIAARAARVGPGALPAGREGVQSAIEGLLSSLERLESQGVAGLAERWGVWALALLAFFALPAGETLLALELDVLTPYLLVVSALAALSFVGARDTRDTRDARARWSLVSALQATARTIGFELASVLAAACVIVPAGSLRISDLSRAQSGWPWGWAMFRSPATLAAFGAALALAVPARLRDDARAASGRTPPESPGRAGTGPSLGARLAADASAFAFGGIAAAVFCGAWEIPGLTALERDAWWGFQLLGAAVFAFKAAALSLAVFALRRTLPRVSARSLARVLGGWVAPLLGAAVVASAGWLFWHPSRGAAVAVQLVTFGVALAAAIAVVARLLHGATTITARHVDPRA